MRRVLISITIFICCFIFMGGVDALTIPAPVITGVESPTATSLKVNYKTNNTNSNYKVLVYNMTAGKLEKQPINTNNYTFTGLETGKVYNFKVRIYYLEGTTPITSNWSNIVSASPKAGSVTINNLSWSNGQGVLSYTTTGFPTGVEIFVKELGKSFKTTNLTSYTITGLSNSSYTITARAYYSNGAYGDWSAPKTFTSSSSSSPSSNASVTLGSLAPSNNALTVNYIVTGSPTGVEVHVKELNKSYKTTDLKSYKITGLTNGKTYTITARTYYNNGTYGTWSAAKTVTLYTSGELIARAAEDIAWPINTKKSIYHHNYKKSKKWTKWSQLGKARPTNNFKIVYDKVRPSHWKIGGKKYGYFTRIGASCDVFVGTSVRHSGYDTGFKFCLGSSKGKQLYHLKHSSKWKRVTGKLKRGDICYKSSHIKIYLGNGKIAEAGYHSQRFGKIYKGSCSSSYKIYRAAK